MDFTLRWDFKLTVRGLPPDDVAAALDTHLDEVMEQMLEQEASTPEVSDPTIGVDHQETRVEVELIVEADSVGDAVRIGDAFARAAVHKAGGYTANWHHTEHGEPRQIDYGLLDVHAEPTPA